MKRVLLFILFFPLLVTAQNVSDDGFVITGKIKDLPESSVVYFAGNNENDTIAKTTVKQGNFILTGKLSNIDGRMLIFPSVNARLFLFIGNEHINITASGISLNDVVVSGSATQADYEEFIYQIKPLGDFVNYYRTQAQSAQTQEAKDSAMIMLNTAYNMYQNSIDRFIDPTKKFASGSTPVGLQLRYRSKQGCGGA